MSATAREAAIAAGITVIPVVLTVIRLYFFSNGDGQTFSALLSNLNVISAIVSGILVILPHALLYAAWFYALHPYSKPITYPYLYKRRTGRPLMVLAAYLVVLPLQPIYFVRQDGYFAFGALLSLLVADFRYRRWFKKNKARLPELRKQGEETGKPLVFELYGFGDPRQYHVTAIAVILTAAAFQLPIGYPAEVVKVRGEEPSSLGYVTAVDDTSLSLVYAGGGLRRIRTEDVEQRIVCPRGSAALKGLTNIRAKDATLAQMAMMDMYSGHPYVPSECSTSETRIR